MQVLIALVHSSLTDIVHHFKPKWLVQSPTAPLNARRCRTCALEEMRNVQRMRDGQQLKRRFCPLYLLSQNLTEVESVVEAVVPTETSALDCEKVSRVLHENSLVARLFDVQKKWDVVGLAGIGADPEAPLDPSDREAIGIAMSIRDCTFYVKIERHGGGSIQQVQTRLGDLDPKQVTPENIQKWCETEKVLINEGWYEVQDGRPSAYRCALEGQERVRVSGGLGVS